MHIKNILISIAGVLLLAVSVLTYKLVQRPTPAQVDISNQNANSKNIDKGLGQESGIGNKPSISRNSCISDECLSIDNLNYPAGDLSNEAKSSLNKALDDEYKAYATYEAIINKLGKVRPFIMIVRAEEQHIASLKALFDKYGLTIPENPYIGKVSSPSTLAEACTAGVDAEIANASLYKDDLLPTVKDREDITLVFTNLMNASQEKHLIAFQRCAQ